MVPSGWMAITHGAQRHMGAWLRGVQAEQARKWGLVILWLRVEGPGLNG